MKKIILLLMILSFSVIAFGQEYKIFKAETGLEINLDNLVDELKDKDVVFFGELHDDSLLHSIEKELLEKLTYADSNFVLGMEAFARNDQVALNKYLAGEYSYEQLDANANLWSNYQEAYSGIIDFAKEDSIKVLATNVPIYISGLVAQQGYQALGNLSESERSYYARVLKLFENEYKEMFIDEISLLFPNNLEDIDPIIIDRLYQAHSLKDDTIAESIFDYLENNLKAKIFHINGDFHSRNHYGIYQKLELLNPMLEIASISPLFLPADKNLEWDYNLYGRGEYIIMYHRDEESAISNNKADSQEFLNISEHEISFIFEPSAKVLTVSDIITFNQDLDNNTLLLSKDIKDLKVFKGEKEVDFDLISGKKEFNRIKINTKARQLKFVYIYDYPKDKQRPYHFNLQEYKWHPVAKLGEKSFYKVNALGPSRMKFIAPAEVTITPQKKDAIYYSWQSFDQEFGFSIIGDLYFTKSSDIKDVLISFYSFEDEYSLLDDYLYFTEQYFELYSQYFGQFGYDTFSVIQSANNAYKSFDNMLLVSDNVFRTKDIFITPGVFGHDLAKIWISSQCTWNQEGGNWQEILANFVANYLWLEKNKPEDAYLWRKDALEDISSIPQEEIRSLQEFSFAANKFAAVNGYKIGGMILYYAYNKSGETRFFAAIRDILASNESLSGFDFFNLLAEKTGVSEIKNMLDEVIPPKVYIRNAESEGTKTRFKIISSLADKSNFNIDIKLSNDSNFVQTAYKINKEETVLEFNFEATKIELDPEYKLYRYLDNKDHIFNLKRTFLEKPILIVPSDNEHFTDIYTIGNTLRSNGVILDMMPLSSLKDINWEEKSILYIGEFYKNPIFEQVEAYLPPSFEFGKNKFSYQGRTFDKEKYSLILNTQNPFNINKSVSFWLWNSDEEIGNIQAIFDYTSPSWVILEFDGESFIEIDKGNLVDEVLFPTSININK